MTSGFDEAKDEPQFMAVSRSDPAMESAYRGALESVRSYIALLQNGADGIYSAKLRFRDPDESERLGEDRFVFLWLTEVRYNPDDGLFSGAFFQVPSELQKWHRVGDQLAFESDAIFDWMVLREGHLYGGFTLRVAREKLPESEHASYDRHIGVSVYEPLP
jgi:uncharacterized protein YegJ (DUF2314 family)